MNTDFWPYQLFFSHDESVFFFTFTFLHFQSYKSGAIERTLQSVQKDRRLLNFCIENSKFVPCK